MRHRKFPISLLPTTAPSRGRERPKQQPKPSSIKPAIDAPKLDWTGCDCTPDGMVPTDEALQVAMSSCGVSQRLARALLAGLRHHWRASERPGAPVGEHRYVSIHEVEECVAAYHAGRADVNYHYRESASITPAASAPAVPDDMDELAS